MRPSLAVLAFLGLVMFDAQSAAAQAVPDPRHSTTDLVVVGNSSGTAIGGTPPGFDVVIRDVFNAPIAGRVIALSFELSAMKIVAVQNAGTTVDCAARTLSRVTDAAGHVNFAPRLAGYDDTNAIRVVSAGELLSTVRGRSTDLDGVDGATGLGDFAIFGDNFLNHTEAQATDYNLSGITNLGDFALFGEEFLRGEVHAYCP